MMDYVNAVGLSVMVAETDSIYAKIALVDTLIAIVVARLNNYQFWKQSFLCEVIGALNTNIYLETCHGVLVGYSAFKNSRGIEFSHFLCWVEYLFCMFIIHVNFFTISLKIFKYTVNLSFIKTRLADAGIVLPITEEDIEKVAPLRSFIHRTSMDEDCTCAVCVDPVTPKMLHRKLPCGHIFHPTCVDEWLTKKGNCPMCRQCMI